jgi:hypothetical protein
MILCRRAVQTTLPYFYDLPALCTFFTIQCWQSVLDFNLCTAALVLPLIGMSTFQSDLGKDWASAYDVAHSGGIANT